MNARWVIAGLAALGATVACAGAASGAELRDPKTGLAVEPPAGFTARIGEPTLGDAVEIVVERDNPETSCSVSFEASTANIGLTQHQLNELVQKKEFLDLVRTAMGAGHEILSLDLMTQDGALGVVLILKSKLEMLARMRTYQAFFDTRRGRTAIQCVAHQDKFDGFRKDYEAITKGVKLPR